MQAHKSLVLKLPATPALILAFPFKPKAQASSPYFFWNFGDPLSGTNDTATFTGISSPPFPTHTFSAPGVYNVCVSFQEPGQPVSTVCRRISVQFCCQGSVISNDSCLENNIPFNVSSSATITSINWNFGDPLSGANNTSSTIAPSHKFTDTGNYTVSATVTATCGTFTSSFTQRIVRCSSLNPICTGTILSSDTCFGKNIAFDINSDKTVISVDWNFDDLASGINNTATGKTTTHRFSSTGNYTVQAIVTFDCGTDTLFRVVRSVSCDTSVIINPPIDSNCKLNFPNAFTPNNDFINDQFGGKFNCRFDVYELIIANRWGQIIFKTTDQTQKWDGSFNGQKAEMGIYFYTVKYAFPNQPEKRISGDVLLIR